MSNKYCKSSTINSALYPITMDRKLIPEHLSLLERDLNYSLFMKSTPTKYSKRIMNFYCIYLMLVIFEGIFRKWIRISSIDFFYFIRDVITFAFVIKIILENRWKSKIPATLILYSGLIILLCIYQLFQNGMTLYVAVFGLRNYLAPLSLALITTVQRTYQELRTAIIFCCSTTIYFQAIIALIQSISPRNSSINFTSWGAGNALVTSGVTVRPIGTFTSSLGFSYYLITCIAALISIRSSKIDRISNLQRFAIIPLLFASAVSGNRTVIFSFSIILILHYISIDHSQRKRGFSLSVFGLSALGILLSAKFLTPVINAFVYRLKYQTEGGSGTLARILGAVLGYRIDFQTAGDGIGVYHQSGVALGAAPHWIENEVPRWIMELGVLGVMIILFRQIWSLVILTRAIRWKGSVNYQYRAFIFALFPMLLFSGISTQPTVQGFAACLLPFAFVRKIESDSSFKKIS